MNFIEKCVKIGKDLLEKVLEADSAELSSRETEMACCFAYGMVLKQAEIDEKDNREVQEAVVAMLKKAFSLHEENARQKCSEMEDIWLNQKDKNEYAMIYQGMQQYKFYADGDFSEVYDMLTNLVDWLHDEREEEDWDDEEKEEEEEKEENKESSGEGKCGEKDGKEPTAKSQADILTGYRIVPETLSSADAVWENMMESSKELVEKLMEVQWFANCGNKNAVSKCEIKYVTKVETAEKYCSSARWENITLDCVHNISSNVPKERDGIGIEWNDVVDEINKRVMSELAEFVNKKWEEKYELSKPFRIEFQSILSSCLLANCYKEFYHEPLFDEILSIYEQGYFPCGWQGRFPEGKLLFF